MHGATKWLMLFATSLNKIGHHNTIYCPMFGIELPEWFQGEIVAFWVGSKRRELSGISKLVSIFFQLIFVFTLPVRVHRDTDVIVLHSEPSLFALPLARLLFRRKKIIYYCYQPPRELYDLKGVARKTFGALYLLLAPLFSIYKIVDKILVRSADCVLVWSDYAQKFTRSIYGDVPLHNVPAGVDFNVFRAVGSTAGAVEELRNRHGLDKQKVLFMNSALIVKKNIPSFFKLIRRLLDRGYPVCGIVIGEGPEKASLQALIRSMGLSPHVKLLGYVTQGDLPNYCHMADIFFYFEQDGIWTMSTIEAGAARKPVIVSSGGSMPSLVVNEETGFIIDAESFDMQVLEKTCCLLDDPDKRVRFGISNHRHSKQFSAESSAREFVNTVQ